MRQLHIYKHTLIILIGSCVPVKKMLIGIITNKIVKAIIPPWDYQIQKESEKIYPPLYL